MRWKIVSSKKPLRASAANDAAALGALFWSSWIVKAPQLVVSSTSYVFPESSAFCGFFCPPSSRGGGWSTSLQPASSCSAAGADSVVFVAGCSSSSSPQAASTSASEQSSTESVLSMAA